MKKNVLLFLTVAFLGLGNATAQLPTTGFYKVKNVNTSYYLGGDESKVQIVALGTNCIFKVTVEDPNLISLRQVTTIKYVGHNSGYSTVWHTELVDNAKFECNIVGESSCSLFKMGKTVGLGTDEITENSTVYADKSTPDKNYEWQFETATPEEISNAVAILKTNMQKEIDAAQELIISSAFGFGETEILALSEVETDLESVTDYDAIIALNIPTIIANFIASEKVPAFAPTAGVNYRIFCMDTDTMRYVNFNYKDNSFTTSKSTLKNYRMVSDDTQLFQFEQISDNVYRIKSVAASLLKDASWYIYGRGNSSHTARLAPSSEKEADTQWTVSYSKTDNGISYYRMYYANTSNYLWLSDDRKDDYDLKTSANTNSYDADLNEIAIVPDSVLSLPLLKMLNIAQNLYDTTVEGITPNTYSAAARTAFQNAISDANLVYTSTAVTSFPQDETAILAATRALLAAKTLYIESEIKLPDVTELTALIAETASADYFLDTRLEIENGATAESITNAKQSAQNFIDGLTLANTDAQVDSVVAMLQNILDAAKPKFVPQNVYYRIYNIYSSRTGYYSSLLNESDNMTYVADKVEYNAEGYDKQIWKFEQVAEGVYVIKQGKDTLYYGYDKNSYEYSLGATAGKEQGTEVRFCYKEYNAAQAHAIFCIASSDSVYILAGYSKNRIRTELSENFSNSAHGNDILQASDVPTHVVDVIPVISQIFVVDRTLYIQNMANGLNRITIYDVMGRILSSEECEGTVYNQQLSQAGCYVVSVEHKGEKENHRIVVK